MKDSVTGIDGSEQNLTPISSGVEKGQQKKKKRFTKQELSWMFYDWANSTYATNIMAAIFPIYFVSVCNPLHHGFGTMMWGYGTALATLVVAILAPLLGAIGDYKGMKKKMLSVFMGMGVTFTLLMAISDNWKLMLVGYVISYIGFMGGNLFYDSFLTDVTTPDRMDKVSSFGYAMGYLGGSTIPFFISIGVLLYLGMDNPLGVKIAVVITSLWWGLFSIPLLMNVRQKHYVEIPAKQLVAKTFASILRTFLSIVKNKSLFIFILAYFFYIDGVNTVIDMATSYGKTLGLDTKGMIMALLVTQLVAVPFSILFSYFAQKIGSIRMILIAVCVYAGICMVGLYMGLAVEAAGRNYPDHGTLYLAAISHAQTLFWIMAVLVGMVQGGIQALSRSYFGKLIPAERSNEYFGFFDVFGKFAAVMGPLLYSVVLGITHSAAWGIASISILFICALIILVAGRKSLRTAEMI